MDDDIETMKSRNKNPFYNSSRSCIWIEWNEEFVVVVCNCLGFKDKCFHQWEAAFMVFDGKKKIDVGSYASKECYPNLLYTIAAIKPHLYHLSLGVVTKCLSASTVAT
ncbi:unnamed protein product [Lactuca saligna]|uniref:Uncharacterized protein n=1 Tax=Lactuca saligna TaxID=75948 RepID=A0AA36A350_LACSI|nr:unnamed protein product [Lactuca saligna]